MAAAVSAVSPAAPSAGDGQRGGERLSHAPGSGGSGECLYPEPGPGGAAVSVSGAAGAGSGSGGGGAGTDTTAVAGCVKRGGGESCKGAVGGRPCLGGGVALWRWASLDGGFALESAGS